MKEIHVVVPGTCRKELRKKFAKKAREDREDAIASLEVINKIAAAHDYDAMSVVLSALSGSESAGDIDTLSAKDLLADLITLFTALDIVLEVKDDFVKVLSEGNSEILQDTVLRKFEDYPPEE